MLRRFGVVTVMDVKGYTTVLYEDDSDDTAEHPYSKGEWDAASTLGEDALFHLDTLKIANINQEGPTKTITGGQNADTLLKYGKTMTIEMQEALGKYGVLENIFGVNFSDNDQIAAVTDRFPGEITLVGTTFVIDQKTGAKQPIKIVIPRFLGDGIFNLTQDAEGDATVFDLNGNVLRFEGGHEGFTTAPTGTDKLYPIGADNQFYFMCTEEVYGVIETDGYQAAWSMDDSAFTPAA
jgi:hypothetical protein